MLDPALKPQIKALATPDWRQFYGWLALNAAAAAAVLTCAQLSPWWLLPAYLFPLGVLQHRIALLGHDACHVRYTRWERLNRLVGEGIGCGLFIRMIGGYREYHFRHHAELGTGDDPELTYRAGWGHDISRRAVARTFVGDLIGLGCRSQLLFMWDVRPKRVIGLLPVAGVWAAVIALLAWAGWHKVYSAWVFALFTSFWAVFRVRAYLEHVGLPADGKHTSHRFATNALFRAAFFPHNTWCHYEHHLFPSIPFHNLPRLRSLLAPPVYKEVRPLRIVLTGSNQPDGVMVQPSR